MIGGVPLITYKPRVRGVEGQVTYTFSLRTTCKQIRIKKDGGEGGMITCKIVYVLFGRPLAWLIGMRHPLHSVDVVSLSPILIMN